MADIDAHLTAADRAIDEGLPLTAIEHLREAALAAPGDERLWIRLADTQMAEAQWADAIPSLEEAINIAPELAVAHSSLATCCLELGDLDRARHALEASLDIEPAAHRYSMLGVVHRRRGDDDEAEKAFREAIEADANCEEALYNLGVLLREKGALDEAVERLRRATGADPQFAAAHAELGFALRSQDKNDEAEAAYRESLRLSERQPWALCYLGELLQFKGDASAAEAHFLKAVEANSRFALAHRLLRNLYLDQQRWDDARRHARLAEDIERE